jgi:uncharacterized membrane protein (UPF0127 family)
MVATKTILGFTVFFVFIYTVPIYNGFKDSEVVLAFINNKNAVIGETRFMVELADTHEERVKGLSERKSLGEKEGLFFIFDIDDYHGIWMKDMNFAIDIIWLDSTMQIVDFVENVSPDSYPEVYKPEKKARYVLEVPAGFFSKNYLKVNDQMTVI